MSDDMIGQCEQLLRDIKEKTDAIEPMGDAIVDLLNEIHKTQSNQVKISEAIIKINKNILSISNVVDANNKYLKDIQYSRGALPDKVLTQIANIEVVSKQLNLMLLGGSNG
ncbi:hypothetical protein CRU98_10050 [Arcobacter sp. CECT 8986]|uniref:hypothetical protein n=1 Tax=Arcobacter sp. CECT 8986 TaxID=2044507 RepID=UPI001009D23B|nr:hypothetical protein [Arcobacter sp. CECT 8986]RXJ98371.1 hypothetical protein CRU98_10050 [Arcobacter sp. CECT 8986]